MPQLCRARLLLAPLALLLTSSSASGQTWMVVGVHSRLGSEVR